MACLRAGARPGGPGGVHAGALRPAAFGGLGNEGRAAPCDGGRAPAGRLAAEAMQGVCGDFYTYLSEVSEVP